MVTLQTFYRGKRTENLNFTVRPIFSERNYVGKILADGAVIHQEQTVCPCIRHSLDTTERHQESL